MKKSFILGLMLAVSAAFAQVLGPGSAAPNIEFKTWVQGKPIKSFSKKGTYVVEFWATWCGPCIQSIPHINELSKKHKQVKFLGVSIWEENTKNEVQDFVKKMADKMTYNVAFGGMREGMAKTWMEAAGQNGIPAAFIVRDRKIMWVGHPMEMDKPLEAVLNGTHDVEKARQAFDAEVAKNQAAQKMYQEASAIEGMINDGKLPEAKDRLGKLESNPDAAPMVKDIKFKLMAIEDTDGWKAECEQRIEKSEEARNNLGMFANRNAKKLPEQAKWLVERLMATAGKFRPNWYPWLNAARVYLQLKEYDKAIAAAERSKQIIQDHQKANPNEPKGNAEDVLNKLIESINKEKAGS